MDTKIVGNENFSVSNELIAGGSWGTCSWSLASNGDMVIGGGTGVSLTSANSSPWNGYKDSIVTVSFLQEVTMHEGDSLSYMFANCSKLQRVDFRGLDTLGVVAMNSMFHSCYALEYLIFGDTFDVSQVSNMSRMFYDCSNLQSLDLSGFDTSKTVDMNSMFEGCVNLISLDLSSWDTSSLIGMSLMFRNCSSLEEINLSGFDTSGVTGISGLFSSCSSLVSLDLSCFDTSNVTNMISMFMNCDNLEYVNLSAFNTSRVIDMSLMFCNCNRLKELDLSGFDTSGVIDMSMMFASCNDLNHLDLSGFDTSKVLSMQNMFMYCSSLINLDLSGFDTGKTEDMNDMFTGCDNLASLTIGSKFTFTGSGNTSCLLPASSSLKYDVLKWTEASTGEEYLPEEIPSNKGDTYFIKGRQFKLSYDANGGIGEMPDSEFVLTAESTPDILDNIFDAPWECVFKEWNTRKNGSGTAYQAGETLNSLCSNVTLYAIWAAAPTIHAPEYLESIEYGNRLDLGQPVIEDNNGEIISSGVEISPDGTYDWEYYDPDTIPTVSYDGYYLRYYAENFVGISYSDKVIIYIDKAVYNMEDVHWEYDEDLIYDGRVKTLTLAELPEGITAEYYGNQATDVGEYLAGATLYYDTENYQMPPEIEECEWEIVKGHHDMSVIEWDYTEPFIYNGRERSVCLANLPDGVMVSYKQNTATDAGIYEAIAVFTVDDEDNYEVPDIEKCIWEIKKASYDMSHIKWQYDQPFVYNGEVRRVQLADLPEGVTAIYQDNKAINAGSYEAAAIFDVDDGYNYEIPARQSCAWEIKKADYDMSAVNWEYEEPFIYNGGTKSIVLTGLPEGVTAEYSGNYRINAGSHTASAVLSYDTFNYERPAVEDCVWEICKADHDMSNVYWNYAPPISYDGGIKTIELKNLPEGVIANYAGNNGIKAGEYEASAVLYAEDDDNYNTPAIEGCQWEIVKAAYDMSAVYWEYDDDIIYDGEIKEIVLKGLPEGVTAMYSGNNAVKAGHYKASAEFEVDDPDNYEIPEVAPLEWSIHKAAYDMQNVFWEYSTDFIYDNEVKTVFLTGLPEEITVEYEGNSERFVGDYEASAKLFIEDTENYEIPEVDSFKWHIEKAEYDMSSVAWDYDEEFIYDGSVKSVRLTGLPEGVTARYIDHTAVYVGSYIASIIFDYDEKNYKMPYVENCHWGIAKADYDMSEVEWDYDDPFTYDGELKTVVLSGLPEGVNADYHENSGTAAGIYEASATLQIDDEINYNVPIVEDHTWEIRKADFDMSGVAWVCEDESVYDGQIKSVILEGLPDGVDVVYDGNTAINAGKYKASARLVLEDDNNYEVPAVDDHMWEIRKADFDMSEVSWVYTDELVYDALPKSVVLEGMPDGLTAVYDGNTAVEAGVYEASVSFIVADEINYNTPEMDGCQWAINKADHDMSEVYWDYDGELFYDGSEKSIILAGLPQGVSAEYSGCSAIDAGSYTAYATLSVDDEDNYNVPAVDSCQWEIKKGAYDMSAAVWDYYDGMFAYDGSSKAVVLTGLPEGVTASYSNDKEVYAGVYNARAVFAIDDKDNYNVPEAQELQWEIKKGDYDISGIAWDYDDPFTYDGSVKTVMLTGLPQGITADYSENSMAEAGVYAATAVLNIDTDNYETPILDECRWIINKALPDISDVEWDYSEPFVYDGAEKFVRLTGLPDGVTARYGDSVMTDAGVYTANAVLSVEDTRNYQPPIVDSCTWEIKKTVYDMSSVSWSYDQAFVYDGTAKSIYLTGLPEGVTANYHGNSAVCAGMYTATATFNYDENNYETPTAAAQHWKIEKTVYDMSDTAWDYGADFVFDGTEKRILLTGLPEGVSPIYNGNSAVGAGIYTADAQFSFDENNYEAPEVDSCEWEIKKAGYDMSNVRWNYSEPFVYDGSEKFVALEEPQKQESSFKRFFKRAKEMPLTGLPEGVAASYAGNFGTEAGIYTAAAILSVDDPENFEIPTVDDCRWEIRKADYDMSSVAWGYSDAFVYDGEEKSVFLTGLPDGVTADYIGNTGVEAGAYEAKVILSIENHDNYEMPAAIDICQWQIDKGHYDMSSAGWNYSRAFVYDGKEKRIGLIGLPAGVTASCSGNSGIDAGVYTADAVLSIEDTHNYEVPAVETCKWVINKAVYDMSSVCWDYDEAFVYDEKAKTIALQNLPEGITANYHDNSKIDAGAYIASAELNYDKDNFEPPVVESCKWKIKKNTYDMSNAEWDYEKTFLYDGKEKSIQITGLPEGVTARYTDNTAINAGKYTAKAEFEYDADNYFEPNTVKTCQWEIAKDTPYLIIQSNAYVKAYSDEKFCLDIKTNADKAKYEAGDKDIVVVAESGDVFIKGIGRTTIIVTVWGENYEPVAEEITVEIIDAQ